HGRIELNLILRNAPIGIQNSLTQRPRSVVVSVYDGKDRQQHARLQGLGHAPAAPTVRVVTASLWAEQFPSPRQRHVCRLLVVASITHGLPPRMGVLSCSMALHLP